MPGPTDWPFCPICAKQFSQRSLKFHLESCAFQHGVPKCPHCNDYHLPHRNCRLTTPKSQPADSTINYTGTDDPRIPCSNCGRRFAPDRHDKHEQICLNANSHKRSVFNSELQRNPSGEFSFSSTKQRSPPPLPKSNWRKDHQSIQTTMKKLKADLQTGGDHH